MIDFTKPLRVKGCSALGVRVVDSAFVARQEFVPLALVVITERDGVDRVAVFGADGIECDLTGMIAKEPVTLENVPEKHVGKADLLANKIEDIIAEFGNDPRVALECVSEYLQLRRASTPPTASPDAALVEAAKVLLDADKDEALNDAVYDAGITHSRFITALRALAGDGK